MSQAENTALGLQTQNVYLMNYLSKLEFLLQEKVRERKRDKKRWGKQLKEIVDAVSDKLGGKIDNVMEYCKKNSL